MQAEQSFAPNRQVGTVEVTAFSADAAAAAGGTVAVTGSGGVAVDVPSQVLGQAPNQMGRVGLLPFGLF